MRNLIVVLHRWVALVTGIFLVLISLSGALIVYEGAIDRLLNPALFKAPLPSGAAARLPLDTLAARAAVHGSVFTLVLPEQPGRPAVATVQGGLEVFLDPYSGAVIGTRTAARRAASFTRFVREVHEQLLAGKAGNFVVVWTTIASVFLVLGGIYLWWQDRIWKIKTGASWKRINFDLHHALGLYGFVVLLLMSATGVVMHYPLLGRAIGKLDREPERDPVPQSAAPAGTPMVSLDAAARTGLATLPGSELRLVSIAPEATRPLTVGLRFPEDHTPAGRSRVSIDRWTGAVLNVRNSRTAGLGTTLNNLQRPLHTGDILGAPTRLLWFLGCLVMASQALTGTLMWWHARPGRLAEARRRREAAG